MSCPPPRRPLHRSSPFLVWCLVLRLLHRLQCFTLRTAFLLHAETSTMCASVLFSFVIHTNLPPVKNFQKMCGQWGRSETRSALNKNRFVASVEKISETGFARHRGDINLPSPSLVVWLRDRRNCACASLPTLKSVFLLGSPHGGPGEKCITVFKTRGLEQQAEAMIHCDVVACLFYVILLPLAEQWIFLILFCFPLSKCEILLD